MRKIIAMIVTLIIFSSCKKKDTTNPVKFFYSGRYLVKEIYDSTGKIQVKQYCNKDTMADGAMIEYYSNGKIASWRWFVSGNNHPVCGIFYNENGIFDTLKGNHILDAIRHPDGSIYIKFPNPPQLSYIIKYVDYYKDKKISERDYEPFKTDTCCWIGLSKHNFEKEHTYKLFFCIVDTVKNEILDAYPEELVFPEKGIK